MSNYSDTIFVNQINTNKIIKIHEKERNFFEEFLEFMKQRIATIEGCPDDCIKWINTKVSYEEQNAYFAKYRTL